MAKIERKAHYVGTWREDAVTDTTMRQIIARSCAEKGQKVKVKLNRDGIVVSKTVLLQESYIYSVPLKDVYFLTVNQRHPTCLLVIVADPVRKYLILAIRTANEVEAQEVINTFRSLKETPDINAGNVVLRRKENGNWTLRERSQHNADRHLMEIFSEGPNDPATATTVTSNGQANGHHHHSPVLDGSGKYAKRSAKHGYNHPSAGSQTVVMDGGDLHVSKMRDEVDSLSQELQEMKFLVEHVGTVKPSELNNHHHHTPNNTNTAANIPNNNNNNNTDKSVYVMTEEAGTVSARSQGDGYYDDMKSLPGVAYVEVQDHRNDTPGIVRALSNGDDDYDGIVRAQSNGDSISGGAPPPTIMLNGHHVSRQVYVPQSDNNQYATITAPTSSSPYVTSGHYVSAHNAYTDIPAYTVQRRVSTEYVQMPQPGGGGGGVLHRKLSNAESLRSGSRVKFHPESVRYHHVSSQDRHLQFRSLRKSRGGGSGDVPTTIVRPIEEIYSHQHHPGGTVVIHGHQRPSILKRQAPPPPPSPALSSSSRAVYIPQQRPGSAVYASQTVPASAVNHHHHHQHKRPASVVYVSHTLPSPAGNHHHHQHQHQQHQLQHRPGSAIYLPTSSSTTTAGGSVVGASHHHHQHQPQQHQSGRKSRPNSIHIMEGNELKLFHKTGEVDDVLL